MMGGRLHTFQLFSNAKRGQGRRDHLPPIHVTFARAASLSRLIGWVGFPAPFLEHRCDHSWYVTVRHKRATMRLKRLKQAGFVERLQGCCADDHGAVISGQAHTCQSLAIQCLFRSWSYIEKRISEAVGDHRSHDLNMLRTSGNIRLQALLHEES